MMCRSPTTLSPDLEFVSATVADPAHGLVDNGSAGQARGPDPDPDSGGAAGGNYPGGPGGEHGGQQRRVTP